MTDRLISHYPGKRFEVSLSEDERVSAANLHVDAKSFARKLLLGRPERGTLPVAEVTRAIPDISMAVRLPEYVILTWQK